MNQPAQPTSAAAPDSSESQSGRPVFPMWLIILTFMLCYWGAVYFDDHGGWFDPKVYGPYRSVAQLEPYQPKVEGNAAQGRAVYGKTCGACHQASGAGIPGQFPPLNGSEWVNEAEPGRMIRIVLNGLQGPITVKGQPYNAVMSPLNSLSDEDIAAVITYVRWNKEWGNTASPVTPEQVKAIREKVKSHPGSFTAEELSKIPPGE
jgi:mono/diheme cytochrome c family protein